MTHFLNKFKFTNIPAYQERYNKSPVFKNIVHFFTGSLFVTLLTILSQFIIPKIISVSDYGLFKTFMLYLGYTSLLHFGLKDGTYIKLCETNTNIDTAKNNHYFSALIYQQLLVSLLLIVIGFIGNSSLRFFILSLGIASFFSIIISYFESFYQALKDFKTVILGKIFREGSFLLLLLFSLLINLNLNTITIIILLISSVIITFLIYIFYLKNKIQLISINKLDLNIVKPVYHRGIKLIMGNFGHQLNTNVDKIFISIFYSTSIFAVYSFGGMFFILSNTLLVSISTVLLPYLYNNKSAPSHQYVQVSKYLSLSVFFILPYLLIIFIIIRTFYQEYIESINIIAYFSYSMIYNAIISVSQNNFLKSLELDAAYIKINYIILTLTLLSMSLLWYFQIPIEFFALLISITMFLRYLSNEIIILRKLRQPYHTMILPNILIIITCTASILIAKLILI